MRLDISYIITLDLEKKDEAIHALRKFCINTTSDTFDSSLINNDSTLSFLLENQLKIGGIQLWIKENDDILVFEFWPLVSKTASMCVKSSYLKGQFINFVRELNGYSLELDTSNGSIELLYLHRDLS